MRIRDWSADVWSSDLAFAGGRPRIKCWHLAPSGSFKDRGMTVMVSYLKACGVGEVMLDSSGNAAASLACYAAAAGLKARLLVPAYTSPAKVAQVRVYGAEEIGRAHV